jgi:8-oxo-dGTP diphosphatase
MAQEEDTMPDQHIHSVSVAGVVVDEAGRVLVAQRRDNGHWQAPGGILERAETFEEGVIREIREETGITVQVERLTGVYKNMPRGIVALVYRCRPRSGTAVPTPESSVVRWVTPTQIPELMAPAYAVRVLDAFTDQPASRAHDGHNVLTTMPSDGRATDLPLTQAAQE